MRHFNAPPGWPEPPNARWRPPKRWGPEESWPSAPPDWPFWIEDDGRRVGGPLGRYGGPSLRPLVTTTGALVAVCGLVLFVLLGPFNGGDDTTQETGSPSASDTELPPPPTVSLLTPGETTVTPTMIPTPSPTTLQTTVSPTPSSVSPSTVPSPTRPPTPTNPPTTVPPPSPAAAPVYYKNCPAVRRAGLLVLLRGMPGYSLRLDPDGDGIACDRRS